MIGRLGVSVAFGLICLLAAPLGFAGTGLDCTARLEQIAHKFKDQFSFERTPDELKIMSISEIKIAGLGFSYSTADKNLWISLTFMEKPYRRQGLGDLLHRRLLELLPEVHSISSIIVGDSFETYKKAVLVGTDPQLAIKETPAYKSRAKLGFSRIITAPERHVDTVSKLPSLDQVNGGVRGATLVLGKPAP